MANTELVEDLEAFGASERLIQQAAQAGEQCLTVWPENWHAFEVFMAMQTQWRVGFGPPVGLDYTALEPVMRMMGTDDVKGTFEAVRHIERGALQAMADRPGARTSTTR